MIDVEKVGNDIVSYPAPFFLSFHINLLILIKSLCVGAYSGYVWLHIGWFSLRLDTVDRVLMDAFCTSSFNISSPNHVICIIKLCGSSRIFIFSAWVNELDIQWYTWTGFWADLVWRKLNFWVWVLILSMLDLPYS